MTDRLYTTREMMDMVGVRSRQTIYTRGWDKLAASRLPPPSGSLLWSKQNVRAIAKELGVKVEWPT